MKFYHVVSFFFAALILSAAAEPAFSKNNVLFIHESGAEHEVIPSVISRQRYIAFNDIAKVYRLSLSFRPVSGKVSLSAFNRRADFVIDSDRYVAADVAKRLRNPVRVSRGRAYLPADFILSADFADFTETETLYYPDTATYIVSVRHNIIPARFYSRPDGTKIVVETKENLAVAHKIGRDRVTLEYSRGKVLEETVGVDDGVVREVRHSNKGRSSVIDIFLSEHAGVPSVSADSADDGGVTVFVPRALSAPRAEPPSASAPEVSPSEVSTSPLVAAAPSPRARPSSPPPSIRAASPVLAAPKTKIVLDAGHGGEDPGAVGPNGTLEKDVNLAVVLELQKLLENEPDIEVILTRSDDTFIPLVDRTSLANDKNADIFISVHCNASMKRSAGGYEVYFLSEKASDPDAMATQILENSVVELEKKKDKKRSKLQELLWSMIVNEFINESSELCYLTTLEIPKRIKVENRGVKQAGFYVLRGAQMPAILVECAFLSNPSEEAKLRNPRVQKQIADGLYVAVKNYLKRKGRAE